MKDPLFNHRIPIQCTSDTVPSILTCDISHTPDTLHIRLIDISDIFTFYQCTITVSSYVHLRNEQELRVDFENFIKKITELFYHVKDGRMRALFEKESGRFVFVEQNEFRDIMRLEIRFKTPDSDGYRKYLAEMMSRMEIANVRLRKENVQVKERLRSTEEETGRRMAELTGRNASMNEKMGRLTERIEALEKENACLADERDSLKKRMVEMEKENSTYKFEIEKGKIEEYRREQEMARLRQVEEFRDGLEKEIKVANDIIRKLREDVRRHSDESARAREETEGAKEESARLARSIEEMRRTAKEKDERIREMKEGLKKKSERIRHLETDRKQLVKKMEEAKFVYNHFYRKRETETSSTSENHASTFSVHPESPPH